jgi:hypothetical protein
MRIFNASEERTPRRGAGFVVARGALEVLMSTATP